MAKPIFEGMLMRARDASGRPARMADLEEKALAMTAEEKARELLRRGEIDLGMLKAWLKEVKRLPMKKPVGKYSVWNKITRSEGTSH